jgi:hypothetical protein
MEDFQRSARKEFPQRRKGRKAVGPVGSVAEMEAWAEGKLDDLEDIDDLDDLDDMEGAARRVFCRGWECVYTVPASLIPDSS